MNEIKKTKAEAQKEYQENFMMFALFVGLAGAGVYKYEHLIRIWFYENMVMLFLCGFAVVGVLIMYVLHRMKKKDREFIARAKSLEHLKPSNKGPQNYYRRRD